MSKYGPGAAEWQRFALAWVAHKDLCRQYVDNAMAEATNFTVKAFAVAEKVSIPVQTLFFGRCTKG